MNTPKPWYTSKTILVAVLQALAGLLVVVITQYPELQTVGWIAVGKSVLDTLLRYATTDKIQ